MLSGTQEKISPRSGGFDLVEEYLTPLRGGFCRWVPGSVPLRAAPSAARPRERGTPYAGVVAQAEPALDTRRTRRHRHGLAAGEYSAPRPRGGGDPCSRRSTAAPRSPEISRASSPPPCSATPSPRPASEAELV